MTEILNKIGTNVFSHTSIPIVISLPHSCATMTTPKTITLLIAREQD